MEGVCVCVRVRALICAVCVRKYRLSILPSRQNNVNQLIRNTITMTELKKNTFFFCICLCQWQIWPKSQTYLMKKKQRRRNP